MLRLTVSSCLVGFLVVPLALGACGKDKEGGAAAPAEGAAASSDTAGTPPYAVTVRKHELHEQVAPNQTHLEQGLGAKAAEGKTFYCVQYELKNTSTEGAHPPEAVLVIGGTPHDVSMAAAGKYLPEDWKETVYGKLEPGTASQESPCFEVDKAAASQPATLTFTKEKWGKRAGWKIEVPVGA